MESGVEDEAMRPVIWLMRNFIPPSAPRKTGFSASFGGGVGNVSTGVFFKASLIKRFQILPANALPPAFIGDAIGVFPTQTPVVIDGVYPSVQASLLSLVVPVFAATGRLPGNTSELLRPNIYARALL